MLKWIGGIMIVITSASLGFQEGYRLQKRVELLEELRKIFYVLRSEIAYKKAPLAEAFEEIAKSTQSPYKEWSYQISERLVKRHRRSFSEIWVQSIEECLVDVISTEERKKLEELGNNMGFLDEKMQIQSIDLYLEQLEMRIKQYRAGLGEKKRLCHCLGVMGGLLLLIILI